MKPKLVNILMLFNLLGFLTNGKGQAPRSIYEYTIRSIDGLEIDLSAYKGKKMLLVNTASKCGFTPQYKELEALYQEYKTKGFVILGFPSNDFAQQEPGTNAEIKEFCSKNYSVTFPLTEKISVKGSGQHPIYQWLTQKKLNGRKNSSVKWNFQKYLVDEEGNLAGMVPSWKKPNCRKIVKWIEKK